MDKSERVLEVWTAAKLFGSQALITAALGHCPYQYFGPPVLLKQICLFPLTILNSRDGAVHEFSSFQVKLSLRHCPLWVLFTEPD